MSAVLLYVRLLFATAVVLAPGWAIARALGVRGIAAPLAWSLTAVFAALGITFAVSGTLTLTLALLLMGGIVALPFALRRPRTRGVLPGAPAAAVCGVLLGILLWHIAGEVGGDGLFHLARITQARRPRRPLARSAERVSRRWPASGLRVPALARIPRTRREGGRRRPDRRRPAPAERPGAGRRARLARGRLVAVPPRRPRPRHGGRLRSPSSRCRPVTAAPTRRSLSPPPRRASCSSRPPSHSRSPSRVAPRGACSPARPPPPSCSPSCTRRTPSFCACRSADSCSCARCGVVATCVARVLGLAALALPAATFLVFADAARRRHGVGLTRRGGAARGLCAPTRGSSTCARWTASASRPTCSDAPASSPWRRFCSCRSRASLHAGAGRRSSSAARSRLR